MKTLLTLGIAALLALTGAAYAYPTLYGATGTGLQPDATVAPGIQVAADFYNTDDDFGSSTIPVRVLYGAGQSFEIGAGYTFVTDANYWNVNAKYATPLALAGAKLAIGAQYFDLTDLSGTITQLYLVGDVPLGAMAKVNLGVNWTKVDAGATDTDAFRFFAGINATLADKLGLVADVQTRNKTLESDMLYSVAVRYPFTPSLSGQIGYTNALPIIPTAGTSKGNLFVGLNYGFDMTK
ncbi:MAG TPA: hypothetical protein VGM23_02430 [Armatimonadota bacterium]|jgi:hypothetical protein